MFASPRRSESLEIMKNGRLICVNFGKCRKADNPVTEDARPGYPCRECGQPLVPIKGKGISPSFFLGLAAILVAGVLAVVLVARLKVGRGTNRNASAGAKIVGNSPSSFDASRYFAGSHVGHLLDKASKGDLTGVRSMLVEQPELLRIAGKGGVTPLHAALFSQEVTAFETLLAEGFDPNASASNGITPLMAAAMHPDSRFLAAALKKTGMVPKQTDSKRRDALLLAVANRQSGNIRLLLRHGADPNCRDSRGNTALMAAFQGRRPKPDAVRLLLEAGADPALTDKTGLNARDFATSFNDPEILALLP